MGRKQKYPDSEQIISSFYAAVSESYNKPASADEVGQGGKKKQELLSEEFNISRIKVRKILITTGDLTYPLTGEIQSMLADGESIPSVCEKLQVSKSTLNSMIPYQKGVYKLSEVSAAAERTQVYRERKAALQLLHDAIQSATDVEQSVSLWKCVVAFQGYPFTTSGRGNREGVRFKYEVAVSGGAGGKHYEGQSVDGFGNELWIISASGEKREKSISRSSVDYAFKIALECCRRGENITGPKQLKIFGSSYIYAIFLRFGLVGDSEI